MIQQIAHLKFRARDWVAINVGARGTYNSVIKLRLKIQ